MENNVQTNLEQTVQDVLSPEGVETTTPTPEPEQTKAPETTSAEQPSNDNSVIRQMREQIAAANKERDAAKSLLERIAKEQNVSIDKLEENLKQKEIQRQANSLNISPEIAAQMRAQEDRIKQLEEQAIKNDFNARVDKLISTTNMNRDQVLQFLNDAQARGFNPLQQGLDLSVLYNAINFDRLSKEKEAKIKQDILNEMQAQRQQSNQIPVTKQTDVNTGNESSSYSDKDFMADLFKTYNK